MSHAPGGALLRVRQTGAATAHFSNIAKADEPPLLAALAAKLGVQADSVPLSLAGHNWGRLAVHGKSLALEVRGLALALPVVVAHSTALPCELTAQAQVLIADAACSHGSMNGM